MKNFQESDIKRLFREATFPVGMQFRDEKLENEYLEIRNSIDIYYKMVILATSFNMYIIALRVTYDYFAGLFQIHEVKGGTTLYIYISILTIILMLLEILPATITKIQILKGFFVGIVPISISIYQSYSFSVSCKSPYPLFYAVQLCYFLAGIPIAFIYCHNWISGAVFLTMLSLINEVYFLIYDWPVMDKMFMSYINLATLVSLVTCLRFIENCRKENFFRVHLVNENNKNTQSILMNLPDPVIVLSDNKISFKNTSYKKMIEEVSRTISSGMQRESENLEENKKENDEVPNNFINARNKITNLIKNNTNQETLKSYINKSLEVGKDNQFTLSSPHLSRSIPFEINSTIVHFADQKQIVYSLRNLSTFAELNEMKSVQVRRCMFVASVSHNFRTPLNIIYGYLEAIEFDPSGLELKNNVYNIKIAASYLEVMVQNLIDFTKIGQKNFIISPYEFRITDLIEETIAIMSSKYFDKDLNLLVEMNIDKDSILFSDKMRIKQILINFLSNAWKFTLNGSVFVKLAFTSHEILQISVIDSGIGISKEDIPKILKRFAKLDDPLNLNENGNGIGLYISKMLSKRIGASITIESEINKGSNFSLNINTNYFFKKLNNVGRKKSKIKKKDTIFPCCSPKNYQKESPRIEKIHVHTDKNFIKIKNSNPESKGETNRNLKFFVDPLIIIADDEVGNRRVLASYLNKMRLKFEEAKNGLEAFKIITKYLESDSSFDKHILIFMDSNMPVMNGETASLRIREFLHQKNCEDPTIICVTANADIQNKDSTDIYDSIIFKPLRYDTFKSIINQIVNV